MILGTAIITGISSLSGWAYFDGRHQPDSRCSWEGCEPIKTGPPSLETHGADEGKTLPFRSLCRQVALA